MRRRRPARMAATAAILLTTAGCFGGNGGGGGGGGGGGDNNVGLAGKPNDNKVEIFGNFPGEEAKLFEASLKGFEQESGIDVTYVPSNDFATLIRSRVSGNNAPDIALFPQPGLLLDIAKQNKLQPLEGIVDTDALQESLIPGFLDATTHEGKIYGAPMRMAVKSLVWYPAPEFEQAGYKAPKTHEELVELTNQIKADGKTPWCIGMESGQATGWVATDWLEEYVLREGGPETYDKWVSHEIPFNDDVVKKAAEDFQEIAFPEGNVLGGRKSIVSTPFGTSQNAMFTNPPGCMLHRQGNFIQGFFPEAVKKDPAANVGLFVLPPVEDGYDGQPILGAGDLAAAFSSEDEDTKEVMEFITSADFGGEWAKGGGWLSPHTTFDAAQYPDDITREIADLAANADVFRFDGSDVMPGAVGAGSFWTGMTGWISGQQDLDAALEQIENSWPSS